VDFENSNLKPKEYSEDKFIDKDFDKNKDKNKNKDKDKDKKIKIPNFDKPKFYYKVNKTNQINYFYSFDNRKKERDNSIFNDTDNNNINYINDSLNNHKDIKINNQENDLQFKLKRKII
jgi:hypothetical protein